MDAEPVRYKNSSQPKTLEPKGDVFHFTIEIPSHLSLLADAMIPKRTSPLQKEQTSSAKSLIAQPPYSCRQSMVRLQQSWHVTSESHSLCLIVGTGYKIRLKHANMFIRSNINYCSYKDLCRIHFYTVRHRYRYRLVAFPFSALHVGVDG